MYGVNGWHHLKDACACWQDDKLKMGRFEFVKLKDPNEVKGLIDSGYAYAQRMDSVGTLARHFGPGS